LIVEAEEWWTGDEAIATRASALGERIRGLDLDPATTPSESVRNGLIRDVYSALWDLRPFAEYVPTEFGGHGGETARTLAVLDAVGAVHPPLSLALALTGALFILPVASHAEAQVRESVLKRFVGHSVCLGGMMMTEPACGSDLLRAGTTIETRGNATVVRGTKHWAGLTGHADYWLVFGRREGHPRSTRFGFAVAEAPRDSAKGSTRRGFAVEEYYDAWGLQPLPYGRSKVDTECGLDAILGPNERYTTVLAGILHGSRLTFAGMTHGVIRGILDRARRHTADRHAFGKALRDHDQVAARVEEMEWAELVGRALCVHAVLEFPRIASVAGDKSWRATLSKAVGTELMSFAADHLAVLSGGNGFRRGSVGLGDVVVTHPWRIFEGPNDILFEQVAREQIRSAGSRDLVQLLGAAAPGWVEEFAPMATSLSSQRALVAAGRILSIAWATRWAREAGCGFKEEELRALDAGSRCYAHRVWAPFRHSSQTLVAAD